MLTTLVESFRPFKRNLTTGLIIMFACWLYFNEATPSFLDSKDVSDVQDLIKRFPESIQIGSLFFVAVFIGSFINNFFSLIPINFLNKVPLFEKRYSQWKQYVGEHEETITQKEALFIPEEIGSVEEVKTTIIGAATQNYLLYQELNSRKREYEEFKYRLVFLWLSIPLLLILKFKFIYILILFGIVGWVVNTWEKDQQKINKSLFIGKVLPLVIGYIFLILVTIYKEPLAAILFMILMFILADAATINQRIRNKAKEKFVEDLEHWIRKAQKDTNKETNIVDLKDLKNWYFGLKIKSETGKYGFPHSKKFMEIGFIKPGTATDQSEDSKAISDQILEFIEGYDVEGNEKKARSLLEKKWLGFVSFLRKFLGVPK